MHNADPIEWKISFSLHGRTYITDKAILIDGDYVSSVVFLPDGTDKNSERIRRRNYKKAEILLKLPVLERFCFTQMQAIPNIGHSFSDQIIFGQRHMDLLLQVIPEDQLYFGMTGGRESPAFIYHGADKIGILMPFIASFPEKADIRALAEAGDAEAQYQMGIYCWINYVKTHEGTAKARKWYASAAAQGHPDACFELARYCREGKYVKKDLVKSLVLLETAIENGSKKAMRYRQSLIKEIPTEQYNQISGRIAASI